MSTGADARRDWFRDWFGDEYLAVYPHRDEREAEAAVRLYLEAAPPPGGAVLDLACGAGRHLRELLAAGLPAFGLDLSQTQLDRAREASPRAHLARGDMRRIPFRDASFSGLTSFFTSFGYFRTPEEDRRVAEEMRRVMSDGASFMLDFLDVERVRSSLVPRETLRIAGFDVSIERSIDGDTVVKRLHLRPDDGGDSRRFEERVRLYSRQDLEDLLNTAGLETRHRFGDYDGTPHRPGSERLILAGIAA